MTAISEEGQWTADSMVEVGLKMILTFIFKVIVDIIVS